MRGDIVYRIYGLHEGRAADSFFGAFRSRPEAEAKIAELITRQMNGQNWAQQYHNLGFVVREAIVATDFEIPLQPKPRDKYFVKGPPKQNRSGWNSTIVEVFQRASDSSEARKIGEFERNYSLLGTFEPFRQGGRDFALISRHYTGTAVMDLASGGIIADEIEEAAARSGTGFCPVGFYVPDWWDLHSGSVIPGSEYWNADYEWPSGAFGFVWGCQWGDDSSLKVQYLDLRDVQRGIIRRDDRFGYIELATAGYESPCLASDVAPAKQSKPPHFISLSRWEGRTEVTFAVEMKFDLESGKSDEWQRRKIANFE